MRNKVILISCYFGRFPNYFELWLNSCKNNPEFTWLLFTDDESKYDYPDNVKIIYTTFQKVLSLVEKTIELTIDVRDPYKFCDFKVLYGIIFRDYIREYSHWGHCDLDLIWGKLSHFITDEKLDTYDRLYDLGHLSIYKNSEQVNNYYKWGYTGLDYKTILESHYHFGFDESKGLNLIYKENKLPILLENVCADINYRSFDFFVNRIKKKYDYFAYVDGEIWGFKQDTKETEFSYIHLQKRKMINGLTGDDQSFYYIHPDRFSHEKRVDYSMFDKLSFMLKSRKNEIISKIKWNYHWKIKWIRRKRHDRII